jgi:4-hydroxy-2-oxoheptanedioate aldolase
MPVTENRFKAALKRDERQIGLWSTLGSAMVAELVGHAGFDWLLIDTEHSPNELPAIVAQLQAMQTGTASAVVRPAWNDPVLIKRILDIGVQSLLIPFVETAEAAAAAVAATRYPPDGIRGVSTGSRAAGYGRIKDYPKAAGAEICVLVQIETKKGVENIDAIANTPGVDGVFVGPADLSASLGCLGDQLNPAVQDTIGRVLAACQKAGKPAGYLTGNEAESKKWLDAGFKFVAVGTDNGVLVSAVDALRERFR